MQGIIAPVYHKIKCQISSREASGQCGAQFLPWPPIITHCTPMVRTLLSTPHTTSIHLLHLRTMFSTFLSQCVSAAPHSSHPNSMLPRSLSHRVAAILSMDTSFSVTENTGREQPPLLKAASSPHPKSLWGSGAHLPSFSSGNNMLWQPFFLIVN